jgi:hypothetical protein
MNADHTIAERLESTRAAGFVVVPKSIRYCEAIQDDDQAFVFLIQQAEACRAIRVLAEDARAKAAEWLDESPDRVIPFYSGGEPTKRWRMFFSVADLGTLFPRAEDASKVLLPWRAIDPTVTGPEYLLENMDI